MIHQRFVIRNFRAGLYLQNFLVAAVAAVLVIRLFLDLTGYPQIGGEGLHIAHMLWGGLLMLAALVLLFSFISKLAQGAAAIIGGIGFGTFIDEIGKFVTSDNDYFFRPAVSIIYVTFILLFLAARAIHLRQTYTEQEYLVNALQEMEEVVLRDLDEEERKRTIQYLEKSAAGNPLVEHLKAALAETELIPTPKLSPLARGRNWLRTKYQWIARAPWFTRAIIAFFIFQLLVKLVYVFVLSFLAGPDRDFVLNSRLMSLVARRAGSLAFPDVAELASSLLSGLFVLWGVIRIRRSRLAALINFERSMLVSIYLTQVFIFYREQFHALIGLAFNIVVLISLRYMIGREREAASPARSTFTAHRPASRPGKAGEVDTR